MLKVGKFYSCSVYFLFLYPDMETARSAASSWEVMAEATAERIEELARRTASYWSKQFDKPVNVCDPKTPLLVLFVKEEYIQVDAGGIPYCCGGRGEETVKEEYIQVLAGDQIGWIKYWDWLDIKELANEAA